MADSKITALTSIGASTDPANDPLVLVDVSDTSMAATGTAKKVTLNQLLGASGTATLASATITGDLTVDTNTFYVNSSTNRVGIGLTSPNRNLSIYGATNSLIHFTTASTGPLNTDGFTLGVETDSSVTLFNSENTPFNFYVNSTLGMTLNSTGLGVGGSPFGGLLTIGSTGITSATSAALTWLTNKATLSITPDGATNGAGTTINYSWANGGQGPLIFRNNAISNVMTLDASGNLLVGKSVSLFSTVGVEASGTGFISATNSASTNATTNLSVYSTGAAAFRFYVGLGGTVYATNTTISAISDARLKENVQDIDVGLGAILALKPRKFDWKAGKGKDIKGDRGFIAQEFEQVFPQLVDEWKDAAPEGEAPYKSVRQDLIPVLVKAIQELAAEVNALKNA